MAEALTTEEKIAIVQQHLKNVLYNQYNVYLSLLESNAVSEKNDQEIARLTEQQNDILAQKTALTSELDSLESQLSK